MSSPSESICGATWPEDTSLVCLRPRGHRGGHRYDDPPVEYGTGGVIGAEAAGQMTASIEANTDIDLGGLVSDVPRHDPTAVHAERPAITDDMVERACQAQENYWADHEGVGDNAAMRAALDAALNGGQS